MDFRQIFVDPVTNEYLEIGQKFKNPKLGETLAKIAKSEESFYEGEIAKKMVCEINAMPYAALDKEMANIHNMFAQGGTIDVAADSVEFDLAAIMGRKAGAAQCQTIYRRCPYTVEQLMQELRA